MVPLSGGKPICFVCKGTREATVHCVDCNLDYCKEDNREVHAVPASELALKAPFLIASCRAIAQAAADRRRCAVAVAFASRVARASASDVTAESDAERAVGHSVRAAVAERRVRAVRGSARDHLLPRLQAEALRR